MKKYIVKIKGGSKPFGEYNSREEASIKVLEYINEYNECVEGDFISTFDFDLEEVETPIVDLIPDFEAACRYLGLPINRAKIDSTDPANGPIIERLQKFIEEINPKHLEALIALNQLFTIAEAWNKADGFVPDFSDWKQEKWFPWFTYNKDAAGFVCEVTVNTPAAADAGIGSRLCFMTSERAEQFGKQFADLYNKVFL